MGIAERKQRAFEAREALIVAQADELLTERGYLGLNLDELAGRVEYSKATLYHHFVSKEDLVLAVVGRHFAIREEYFTRACHYDGLTRERMFAFGIADRLLSRRFPHGFPLVQFVRLPSVWHKCSEARQRHYYETAGRILELGMTVARDASEAGDFESWSPAPEQVFWGLVSLSKGAHLITEEGLFREAGSGEGEPLQFLFENYHRFLDGAGWNPLSRVHDYDAARARIEGTIFAEEVAALD